ncbi:MAG: hypothetical protein RL318_1675 [Fibrobacterota bacterium]|jgi:hypothetical protein
MSRKPPGTPFRWLDLPLLVSLIAGGSWLWLGQPVQDGSRAVVRYQGKELAWWPLAGKLARDTVQGRLGPLVIEHGQDQVRLVSSPCANQICVHQGRVRHVSDKLVCVPSGVVIVVEGKHAQGELDAIQ